MGREGRVTGRAVVVCSNEDWWVTDRAGVM